MFRLSIVRRLSVVFLFCCMTACGSREYAAASTNLEGPLSYAANASKVMGSYTLAGDTRPLHDPAVIRSGSNYYLFTTDVLGLPPGNFLPIRCSQDKVKWSQCGSVFQQIPAWVSKKVPGIVGLWAPDISYFNGVYHLYYAGSTLGSQQSVIGLATNTTLDSTDPSYKWVDRGEVLESVTGDDFNAIDPNIFIDSDGSVWLTYGSYWSGIKQIQLDPSTGLVKAAATRYDLATRPGVPGDPIEGASIVQHHGFYYLFISIDFCCNPDVSTDDYKEAVGRSTSPHGPFVDMSGTPMMNGGGTVILEQQGIWNAAAGGTAYIDAGTGESLLVFHALNMSENGAMYVWVKGIDWTNDWPELVTAQ